MKYPVASCSLWCLRPSFGGRRGFPTLLMRKTAGQRGDVLWSENLLKESCEPRVHAGFLTLMPLNLRSVSDGGAGTAAARAGQGPLLPKHQWWVMPCWAFQGSGLWTLCREPRRSGNGSARTHGPPTPGMASGKLELVLWKRPLGCETLEKENPPTRGKGGCKDGCGRGASGRGHCFSPGESGLIKV